MLNENQGMPRVIVLLKAKTMGCTIHGGTSQNGEFKRPGLISQSSIDGWLAGSVRPINAHYRAFASMLPSSLTGIECRVLPSLPTR